MRKERYRVQKPYFTWRFVRNKVSHGNYMTELISMINIGKELERKLKIIGIKSAEELKQLGSKETFFRLKQRFPEICLVHLYTLEGAITNTKFNELSEETKKDLKEFSDEWK